MFKRSLSLFLFLSLLLSCVPLVSASSFSDTKDHWAAGYIDDVVSAGLFNGVSEDRFSPNSTMTRGMFVTVLGRFEGIDTEHWNKDSIIHFFDDISGGLYYTPHVRWAFCNGIVNGMTERTFVPDAPITREQMAKLVAFYVDKMGHSFSSEEESETQPPVLDDSELPMDEFDTTAPSEAEDDSDAPSDSPADEDTNAKPSVIFADEDQISSWALESVYKLCEAGILTGSRNSDGSFSFHPQDTATRAECAAVFSRVLHSIVKSEKSSEPVAVYLSEFFLTIEVGSSYQMIADTVPENSPLFWHSSDPSVLSVDHNGLITAHMPGSATITVYTTSGLYNNCQVLCETPAPPAEDLPADPPAIGYPNEYFSHSDKCQFLFGEYVSNPRQYYNGDKAAALEDMVEVEIRAWDFKSKNSDEKITRTWKLKVHKNLADTVIAIFEEIYNGEEQFPIHYLGAFSWSANSEHSIGTAIDINYNENYYCMPDGTAITGSYWKPGEDPYSITPGGDLHRAFTKYGFEWGINWSSGKKDYMHFSFFGT